VAQWYQSAGYEVVDRNWRCVGIGEIDVVARRGPVLVVCEVKTRSTDRYGSPAHAVTPAKQARLRRLAIAWIREHRVSAPVIRFDVATVVGPRLEVIEGAF
jgi:putative endonuclease